MEPSAMFTQPSSYRLLALAQNAYDMPFKILEKPADNHSSITHLCLLVFEAVLEVVCVSLPGYIVARLGHFDAEKQKFLANLNVMLFTPCLIFTKLASQLNAEKLSDLAIIPAIFLVQTLVSWIVSILIGKAFRFDRRASNFVTAMGVFGNSNSLPISLVLSLSQTIKGLHWDRIPGDNDDEVGARGILYLLIFQQLGQLVRWSWGYHVLLAPKERYTEYQDQLIEEGQVRHDHEEHTEEEAEALIRNFSQDTNGEDAVETHSIDSRAYEPAGPTPIGGASRTSVVGSSDCEEEDTLSKKKRLHSSTTLNEDAANPAVLRNSASDPQVDSDHDAEVPASLLARLRRFVRQKVCLISDSVSVFFVRCYNGLPRPFQILFGLLRRATMKTVNFIWDFMNPPLWAMLIAVLVASIPALQRLFFEEGSFVKNSVTSAVRSNGGVAVPLILVVLGANLARNTMARGDVIDPEEERIGNKLLIASLLSRMVLPTCIMAPILAITAKYLPISILDDPIFIVVCFLLTGAPSALQLAQICQINNVYEKTMGRILFQSYVVWILPSTLVLVMIALEVIEWAK